MTQGNGSKPEGRRDRAGRRRAYAIAYFLAILPDQETAGHIDRTAADLRRRYGLRRPAIGAERYHITLSGASRAGEAESDFVGRVARAIQPISMSRFAVCLDQALSYSEHAARHPFVLQPSEELPALHAFRADLCLSLKSAGLQVSAPRSPHLTLLYDENHVPATAIRPIHWTVEDFVLIRSWQGLSRYDELGRWPLHPVGAGRPGGPPGSGTVGSA